MVKASLAIPEFLGPLGHDCRPRLRVVIDREARFIRLQKVQTVGQKRLYLGRVLFRPNSEVGEGVLECSGQGSEPNEAQPSEARR